MTEISQEFVQKVSDWTRQARTGANQLAVASTGRKNEALQSIATQLRAQTNAIIAANQKDLEANRERLTDAQIDRLKLDEGRIENIAAAVEEIIQLPDPVGRTTEGSVRPNGLKVHQKTIPLGVVLMIFESRPNVMIDAGVLCIKSGNAAILRGGRETIHTGAVFQQVYRSALEQAGFDPNCVQIVDNPDRALVSELLGREGEIDLVIPRGGESLIRAVTDQSRIPVIQHFKGVCHVFVHGSADHEKAAAIALNAKTQRPGVCNAMETLLIDSAYPAAQAADIINQLQNAGVEVVGCEKTVALASNVALASDQDWDEEYLALKVAVRIVEGIEGAVEHINLHGSNHTEAIVAQDWDACLEFEHAIQSSTVVVNASTCFADGGELGLGAEIGISTSKLHAYGPMGLEGLTTKKFVVLGQGQVRS